MPDVRRALFVIMAVSIALTWNTVAAAAQNINDATSSPSFAEQWAACGVKNFQTCATQLLNQQGSLENCQTIHDPYSPYAADGCIQMLAGIKKDPGLCEHVEFKDHCFFELAKTMHDTAVCRKASAIGGMRGSCYSLVAPSRKRNVDNLFLLGLAVVLAAALIWLVRSTIRSPRFALAKGVIWGALVGSFPLTTSALGFGGVLSVFVFPVFWVLLVVFSTQQHTFQQEEPLLSTRLQTTIMVFIACVLFYGLVFFLLGRHWYKTLTALICVSLVLNGLAFVAMLGAGIG